MGPKKLFLTAKQVKDKYKELREINFEFPYFYKLVKKNQYLYFIGTAHALALEPALKALII
ncbi:hypothetical protein HY045_02420 [Candidatus Woesebacteria bacterium]|nr:hypothetical protein [Candidatus Woesebacteria bacterium]